MTISYAPLSQPTTPPADPEALLDRYGSLVERVARRVMRRLPPGGRFVEVTELVSTGFIGLLQAAERFDPATGLSFEAFAEYRVKGAMLDELRRRDFFPRRLRVKATRLERARRKLEAELGREPSAEELADALNLSVSQFTRLRDQVTPYRFIAVEDLSNNLSCNNASAHILALERQQSEQMYQAIENLPERERLVIRLYYLQEQSLREIAELLALSVGRISQIKTEAIRRLQYLIAN